MDWWFKNSGNYEAEGIVPFVANSPFMSFFYTKNAPEYKDYKLKEGEFNKEKHQWHVENNTYTFSHGLGIAIMSFGILTLLGILVSKDWVRWFGLSHPHDDRYAVVPRHHTRSLGARSWQW